MSGYKDIDEKMCERILNFIYPPEHEMLDEEISAELIRLDIDTSQALERVKEAIRKDKAIKSLEKALKVKNKINPNYSEHTIKLAADEMMVYIEEALRILREKSK